MDMIVDSQVVKNAKKYARIYKKTKSRRIRKKNMKKLQAVVFPEIDRLIEARTQQQFFDSFAAVGSSF